MYTAVYGKDADHKRQLYAVLTGSAFNNDKDNGGMNYENLMDFLDEQAALWSHNPEFTVEIHEDMASIAGAIK